MELKELLRQARETRRQFVEELGHSIDVPANPIANELADYVERMLTIITLLEDENKKLIKLVESAQKDYYCLQDTLDYLQFGAS